MALSIQALLLALSLLLWVFTLTCEGAMPKCCLYTDRSITPRLLRRAEKIEVQSSGGFCDINALIIHVKGKKFCAHLPKKEILTKILKRRSGKKRMKSRLGI
ncbi:C-C motif chemokine 27a [Anguilla anguilla]|uniref:C-C motif chemokine 27a n=1 Tax=Anguilla anguilla TaxID=7936 RepID=UPI0015B27ECA|nr:C-C motif chemokine 27a [Anguilla anguilla]